MVIEQLPYFLRERELAARWRLSLRTLQRWRHAGNGPAWHKINGRVIYSREEVLASEEAARRSGDDPA